MIKPDILPDEWLSGYWGRVIRVNDCTLRKTALLKLRRFLGSAVAGGKSPPLAYMLAKFTDVPLGDLLVRHTQIPYIRTVSRGALTPHSALSDYAYLRKLSFRPTRKNAMLCEECVHEDLIARKLSYWHRKHQLFGQIHCPKHGSLLCAATADSLYRCPHQVLSIARPMTELGAESASFAKRFSDISQRLLEAGVPLEEREVGVKLRSRLRDVGLSAGTEVTNSFFHHVDRVVPAEWAKKVWTDIERNSGGYLPNSVINRPAATPNVVLALSVLFDSADDAVEFLFSTNGRFERRLSMEDAENLSFWRSEAVVRAYFSARSEGELIAQRFGVNRKTSNSRLADAGYRLYRSGPFRRLVGGLEKFFDGYSLSDAAADARMSPTDIEGLLRVLGWELFGKVLDDLNDVTALSPHSET